MLELRRPCLVLRLSQMLSIIETKRARRQRMQKIAHAYIHGARFAKTEQVSAYLYVIAFTGARCSQVEQLKWSDINLWEQELRINGRHFDLRAFRELFRALWAVVPLSEAAEDDACVFSVPPAELRAQAKVALARGLEWAKHVEACHKPQEQRSATACAM